MKNLPWHERRFEPRATCVQCNCLECGVAMWLPKSKVAIYSRCSAACNQVFRDRVRAARRRDCETCGKSFVPRTTQISNGQGRVCSQACNLAGRTAMQSVEAQSRAVAKMRHLRSQGLVNHPRGEDHPHWKGGKEAYDARLAATADIRSARRKARIPASLPTAQEVRENLSYDPETGIFHWIKPNIGRKLGSVAGHRCSISGYVEIRMCGRLHRAHRLAWVHVHGEWPKHEIDHVNRDRRDNRIANLRSATRAENARNVPSHAGSTSKYRGVSWNAARGKWVAQIYIGGRNRRLGTFADEDAAHRAYRAAADKAFGEFARVA